MKNIKMIFILCILILPGLASAGSCGEGRVLSIMEGGWNSDNLLIKIDYAVSAGDHSGTEFNGFIRYKLSSVPNRINAIRSAAIAAILAGKTVRLYSHNNDCSDATQFRIFN